jgi:hypothetical protein
MIYLHRVDVPEIDYRAELPPHRQIAAWLLTRIESGELAEGQPMPSEKELIGPVRGGAHHGLALHCLAGGGRSRDRKHPGSFGQRQALW